MSEKGTHSPKHAFYGYPIPKEGPDTGFTRKYLENPVLRGTQLGIAAWAVSKFQTLARYLWNNAGFNELRQYEQFLHDFEPRYDPTVIPIKPATAAAVKDSSSIEPSGHSPALLTQLESHLNELAIVGKYREYNPRHYTVADYNTAYKSGILEPLAVAKAILKILQTSPAHKVAFVRSHETIVLAAAKASTARWKAGQPISVLDGVPVGVKDEVDLDQYQMHLGSKREFTRSKGGTAWCVRKWEEAGAVVVGKLNMHELGLDTTNLNTVTGTPVNPHNLNYYPGGSSGGSAHAVSSGILPITLGADGGGSIRIPASFCGVYGLKPTHGRVSAGPGPNLAFSCGVLGPLASNMDDIEIAYRIMA
ncbi:hypothetical protein MMC31_004337, partial [Peltigera leucophlebia]|nr:hypothetical protein [Peltigera leucophlebia]